MVLSAQQTAVVVALRETSWSEGEPRVGSSRAAATHHMCIAPADPGRVSMAISRSPLVARSAPSPYHERTRAPEVTSDPVVDELRSRLLRKL